MSTQEIRDAEPGAVRAPGGSAEHRTRRRRPAWADGLWVSTAALLLVFGTLTVFLMPPGQGGDEPNHFFRVNGLLNGVLVPTPTGINAPTRFDACTVDYMYAASQRSIREGPMRLGNFDDYPSTCHGRTGAIDYDNTAIYSPVPYVPQLLGTGVMRVLGAGPVAAFYAARLLGLLAYIALALAALRLAPSGRLFFAGVALLPMSVIQASVVNTDGMSYGLALLAAALVLRLREREDPDRRGAVALAVVLAALALTKVPYIAFVGLLLVVPWRHFAPEARRGNLLRLAAAAVPVALLLGWNLLVSDLTVNNLPTVDPGRQAKWIGQHPFAFLDILRHSMFSDATRFIFVEMPGAFSFFRPTPVSPTLPMWGVVAAYVMLAFALAAGRQAAFVTGARERLAGAWVLGAALGGIALVFLALFLAWTDVGDKGVNGIQPRYFVPFLSFLPIAASALLVRGRTLPPWQPFVAVSAVLLVAITYQITLVYY